MHIYRNEMSHFNTYNSQWFPQKIGGGVRDPPGDKHNR